MKSYIVFITLLIIIFLIAKYVLNESKVFLEYDCRIILTHHSQILSIIIAGTITYMLIE